MARPPVQYWALLKRVLHTNSSRPESKPSISSEQFAAQPAKDPEAWVSSCSPPLMRNSGATPTVVQLGTALIAHGAKLSLKGMADIFKRPPGMRRADGGRRTGIMLDEPTTYFHELIENSPAAILVLDPDHRVEMCNPAFERLSGYTRREPSRANLEDLIATSPFAPGAVNIWQRVLAGEKVYVSTKCCSKDRSVVDVEIHGIPLTVKGKLIGVYGIYHDVSQRQQAELAITQLSERLLNLQDEERRRLARERHDTSAQTSVALNLTRIRRWEGDLNTSRLPRA